MESCWYHGTNESSALNICEKGIDFSKSKKELDFGSGFYLTDDFEVAKKRAISQTTKYNRIYKVKENPAIVTVIIDMNVVEQLNLKSFEYCNEEWLRFVIANRLSKEYLEEHSIMEHNINLKYDAVKGSIADSDISSIAAHVENGNLTFEDISVYDILTDDGRTLGFQMSLHTKDSLLSVKSKTFDIMFEGRNE